MYIILFNLYIDQGGNRDTQDRMGVWQEGCHGVGGVWAPSTITNGMTSTMGTRTCGAARRVAATHEGLLVPVVVDGVPCSQPAAVTQVVGQGL